MKIGTFSGSGTIHFELESQRKCINKYYLGQKSCNQVREDGKIVSIEHDSMDKVEFAQRNLCSHIHIQVKADLDDSGKLSNFRIE